MTSSYTPNKNIEQPSNGSYLNDWNVPVNGNSQIIDTALGGTANISVGGVTTNQTLTIAQYTPMNIQFNGALSQSLLYWVPTNVGGTWTIFNNTTGNFTLSFGVYSAGGLTLLPGLRTLLVSNGESIGYADQSYAYTQGQNAVTASTSNLATARDSASTFFTNGASHGVVPPAYLPNSIALNGVTIMANPGTAPTPTGPYQVWYYY